YDWISVAEALATDREVASFDKRGFGETGWSPSKDYSVDANMGDILAVLGELKWERPIIAGHSASGRLTISFAANFPDKISRLIVVDSGLAREEGGARSPTGNPPLVFDTVEAAMAHFAKLSNPPRIAHDRERALAALVKVDKGLMLKRDPDFQNSSPQGEGANLPQRARRDVWAELAAVKCPIMIVRGLRSDRYTPEIIARISRDYPATESPTVDSQHAVAPPPPHPPALAKLPAGGRGLLPPLSIRTIELVRVMTTPTQDKQKEIAFFDGHAAADDYDVFEPQASARIVDAFVKLTELAPGARVIDLGC